MLKLSALKIEDFGPFKDTQQISFDEEPGVTLIYGENMRGKTILLNAIRYALFGKVLGRGSKEISLHQLTNWEKAERGEAGFRIVLDFEVDGEKYELSRVTRPKSGASSPSSDRDFTQETFLKRGNAVLGPDERDAELSRIMPEQVSRFFLFDGELLQEYEELLRDESEMGTRIMQAIERILGVPVLTNARADLHEQSKLASKKLSVAAQRDQKTREIGNHISSLNEQREHHESEISRLEQELAELTDRKNSVQENLRRNERVRYLLQERDNLERDSKQLEEQAVERREEVQILLSKAWKGVLGNQIRNLRAEYSNELLELQTNRVQAASRIELAHMMEEAANESKCPVCGSNLSEQHVEGIHKQLLKVDQVVKDESTDNRIQELAGQVNILDRFEIGDEASKALSELKRLDELAVDRATKIDRINEIDGQTRDFDQSQLRQLMAESDRIVKLMAVVEEGLAKEKESLADNERTINKLREQLEKSAGSSLQDEHRQAELCEQLHSLFNEAVDIYRDRLRESIQGDASALFRELTTEPEYAKLEINQNYGLTIIHKDGHAIPIRSAGAEHIVALSLMGALQRNAPMRGPIIMDSPFGRLDDAHTSRVVEALPDMADQVVLLVYESELSPKKARETLKGRLRAEYRLQRVSARHTSINRLTEG